MPIMQSLFLSAQEVNVKLDVAGRRLGAPLSLFGHLRLPGGSRRYPRSYITVLLSDTTGPITAQMLHRFNQTDRAKREMEIVKGMLLKRLRAGVVARRQPEVLRRDTTASALGVSDTAITGWISQGILPVIKEANGRVYIPLQGLLSHCKWVLPTT